ncbi:motility associated factor glycosyltransferase family protein [Anoxynatronum buryatiense]|uniref:Uncharacterized conserved protein n=1 Tax=Anoxynatronum buryatiense TaxID=489973 RepID=A0AA46AIP1_9CLOT|nr:6-hydroxymethylpterin diphosphokinase MptE-like protein [Anoxynatronum buryatiense]SMP52512.1 Uncharacterized conserved protein [Anoxynatronum buryatiense]
MNPLFTENLGHATTFLSFDEKEHFLKSIQFIETEVHRYAIQPSKKSGVPVPQNEKGVYYHSRYDPEREAEAWAKEQIGSSCSHYVIFGFAFAYHLEALHQLVPKAKMTVIETDSQLVSLCFFHRNLKNLFCSGEVTVHLKTTIQEVAACIQRLLQDETSTLLLYPASVKAIPDSMKELKILLESFRHQSFSIRRGSDHLDQNFQRNIKHADFFAAIFNNVFQEIPLVLVSAGPSLDKNVHMLRELQPYSLVLAVGRAVKPLLAAGVVPDMVIITDGQYFVYQQQLEGLGLEIPLIGLSTCDPKAFARHQGLRGIAFQEGFSKAEKEALKQEVPTTKTGGSVATTALDIAIGWGCNPIILVGQDLALEAGKTHANAAGRGMVRHEATLLKVRGNVTEYVMTTKNLNAYRVWMEQRIRQAPDTTVVNATEGGAYIAGTQVCSLEKVLSILEKSEELERLLSNRINEMTDHHYLLGEIMGHRKAREKVELKVLHFTVEFRTI